MYSAFVSFVENDLTFNDDIILALYFSFHFARFYF